ncbi:MerR family transcriptional regulator [Streptomyces sp. NPDC001774]
MRDEADRDAPTEAHGWSGADGRTGIDGRTGTEAWTGTEGWTGTDGRTGAEGLTVGQVSARLGVTVRALHHWDEIGLARPSLRTPAGYRLYTAGDLERLHRIVVYRELGLGLDRIRVVLDDPAADLPGALRAQRIQVDERIDRLRRLGAGLDRMIEAHERGLLLTAEQQAAIFGPDWDPDASARARERYGDTTQWRQYAERSAARGPEEWQAVADANAELDRALAEAMDAGVTPGSPEANQLVERHREMFASYFPLSRQMQVCLGRMYESDPGFAAHYDGIRAGLATWFRRIVDAGARAHGIDPDTATWE